MNVSWFFSGLDYLQSEVSKYCAFLTFAEKTELNKPVIKTYYDFENFIFTLPEYQKVGTDAYAKIISDFINLKMSSQPSHRSASRLGMLDTFHALAHTAKDDLKALHELASLTDQYEDRGLAYATAEGYRAQGKHPELMLKYYHLATVYDHSSIDEENNYVSLAYERLSELYQTEGLLPQSDTFAKHFKFKASCYDGDLAKAFLEINENNLKMEEKAVFFLQKGMVCFYQDDIDHAVLWLKKAKNYRNKTPSAYETGLFNQYYKTIGDYYITLATSTAEQSEKNAYFKLGADFYLQISANATNYIAMHLEAANLYAECLDDKNKAYDILVKVDQAKSNNYNRGKFDTTLFNTTDIFFDMPGKVRNYYNYLRAWMSKWRNGLTGTNTHEFVEPFNQNRDNPIEGYLFYKNYYGERRKYIMSHARLEKKSTYTNEQLQRLKNDFNTTSVFRNAIEETVNQVAALYPENGNSPGSEASNGEENATLFPRTTNQSSNSWSFSFLNALYAVCGFSGNDDTEEGNGKVNTAKNSNNKNSGSLRGSATTITVPANVDPLFSCLCQQRSQLLQLLHADNTSKITLSSEEGEALILYNDEVIYKKLQDIITLTNNIINYCQISESNQAAHLPFLNALRQLEVQARTGAISIHRTQIKLDEMKTENIGILKQDIQNIRAEQVSIKEKLESGELFEEAVNKKVSEIVDGIVNQKLVENNRAWKDEMAAKDKELTDTKQELANTKQELAHTKQELANTKQELKEKMEKMDERFSKFEEMYKRKAEKARERKLKLKQVEPTLKFFNQLKQSHECFTEDGKKFSIPDDCYCSITLEIMKDPVIASDGFTYERSAIETWLASHNTSPKRNLPLTSNILIPNIALKNTIESILVQIMHEKTVRSLSHQ